MTNTCRSMTVLCHVLNMLFDSLEVMECLEWNTFKKNQRLNFLGETKMLTTYSNICQTVE